MKFLKKYFEFMIKNTKTKYKNILIVLTINAITSVITVLFAYLSKDIIDRVFVQKDVLYMHYIIKILAIISLIYFLIEILGLYYTTIWKINSEFNLKKMFFKNIQNVLYGNLEKISDTSLYHRLFSDGATISEYFYTLSIVIPFNFFYVAFILFFMWKWSKILTMYALILFVLEIVNIKVAKKPILAVAEKQKEVDQNLANYVMEKIELISFAQIMNMRLKNTNDVFQKFHDSKRITVNNFFYMSIFDQVSNLIRQIWSLGLFIVGANLIISNKITIGVFVGYQALLGYLMNPFSTLVNSLMSYQSNKVCFKRFVEYYELPKINDSLEINFNFCDEINICNIDFSYEKKIIFKNFNGIIKKGEVIAVSGDSGSGKTTLMKIISSNLLSYEGNIFWDGKNYKEISSQLIKNSIACVSSDDYIFNMSIRNNIILDKKYDAELLYDVIKRTKIEDFIKDLPRGLETELKSNNLTLSAGQIQRICLARALYSERDLIFIDEGTANLDIKNSEYIEKELFLDSNLTVVMITHRLNDNIAILSDNIYTL